MDRSRCSRMFFKVNVLKNFAIFSEKHLCKNHFFIKVQTWKPATLLKRDSNTGVFLLVLWILLQNTSGGCFFMKWKNFLFFVNIHNAYIILRFCLNDSLNTHAWTWFILESFLMTELLTRSSKFISGKILAK